MDALQPKTSTCTNCGAKLTATPNAKGEVNCEFCGTTFVVAASKPAPAAPAPAPAQAAPGAVLLAADFRDEEVPGWLLDDETSSIDGDPPELVCSFEPTEEDTATYPLESEGSFDDLDASVTVRWVDSPEGEDDAPAYAGLTLRSGDAGYYFVCVGSDATYAVWWYADNDAGALVEDATHPQLQADQPVRLRVVAQGAHLKVYLNGVLATATKDPRATPLESGTVGLSVESMDASAEVAFSDVQVREAPQK